MMKHSLTIKSILCLLLATVMVLSMAACGGNPGPDPASGGQVSGGGDISGDSSDPSGGDSASDGEDRRTPKEIFDDMAKKTVTYYELNDDTVGWLYVPGTTIDESVVQGDDNNVYLRRNNLGRNAFDGCYFADYRTKLGKRGTLSKNVVVYGHSMDDWSTARNTPMSILPCPRRII